MTKRDDYGWQVLHQGVAAGEEKIVEYLIEQGADVNARTFGGGETPLRIAERMFGIGSPLVHYLKEMGALSIGPDL